MSVACIAFGIASTVTSGSDDTDRTGAALWCGVIFFIISAYHACAVSKGRIQTTVSIFRLEPTTYGHHEVCCD